MHLFILKFLRQRTCCLCLLFFLISPAIRLTFADEGSTSPTSGTSSYPTTLPHTTTPTNYVPEIIYRSSGVRFFDLVAGSGESPVFGEIVRVHFVASWIPWYETHRVKPDNYGMGTKFDSTRDRGVPFEWTMGSNRVPRGVNEAVESMHTGGSRVAILPAAVGFGNRRIGTVPKNSTLIYELELMQVLGVDKSVLDYGDYDSDSDSDSDYAYDINWIDPHSNSSDDYEFDDDDYHTAYIEGINEMLTNVSNRLDNLFNEPEGTVSSVFSVIVNLLAACFVGVCIMWCGHWMYAKKQKKNYFHRLRQDYIDNELEMDDL